MISYHQIVACWNRFFFEPISPVPIAIYRIAFGILLTVNFLLMIPEVPAWFSEKGTLAIDIAGKIPGGKGFKTFNLWPAGDGWVWVYFWTLTLSAVSFTLGLFTRASSIVIFVMIIGLHHRNPLILNSGDAVMRLVSFFMMFTPAGAAYSLDRWMRVKKGREKGPPRPREPWAQRLIQIQLVFIYLHTFTWKAMGPMWLDGTAVYYTARLPEFWRFPVPYVYEHMWTIKLWTWGTLVVEFALAVLVWVKEFRYWVLLAGVMLHLGIDYSMNIPLFGPLMITAYITFVEPEHLQRVLSWCRQKFHRTSPAPAPALARPARPKSESIASSNK